ncbi:MAG: AMP-binding protein [bacterium]
MQLLHHQFIKVAKKNGNKPAFIDCTSNKRISYSKALIASIILARRFMRFKEGFLGIMIPSSAGCGLSVIASLMSGRTPVMINYSTGAADNAEYAQKHCGFRSIVTSRALLERIRCRLVKGMVFIEDIMERVTKVEKVNAAVLSKMPKGLILKTMSSGDVDDNATILFTSGSEKDPKAVQLTHKNISSNIESFAAMFELSSEDSMLAQLPFFHVFGLTVCLWTPIYLGMTEITYANPLDFKAVCDIVKNEKPTMMVGTPSFFRGYLKKSEPGDFNSLRIVVAGADKCPDALREGFKEKHHITLLEGYGTTETSPVVSVNTHTHNKPGSIGRPLPDVKVKIENYETGEECPKGEVGKIMVKGDNVMKGYFDDIEETALHIRHGWYDTGDMGLIDEDGFIWHQGRLKRFVKIGGEMISLVKVENVLEELLPEEVSCGVVEVPDATKGAKIVAAVTERVNEKEILKRMAKHLPNIALPKQFVVIEEFPKMGSGKIDFRAMTEMVRDMLENNPR